MGKRNSSGFTMFELVIALTVMGILILFAAPSLSKFSSGYKLRGLARELASDLQFARHLAIKENMTSRVTCATNSYQLIKVSDGSVVKTRNLAEDYPGLQLTNISITFNSRGDCNAGTINVSNVEGTRTVNVASTGKVKVL